MIRPAPSETPAGWLLEPGVDWWDLVRYGPPGFEVYLRIGFGTPTEGDGELPALRTALAVLADHTTTPQQGYAAVWEGCLNPEAAPAAPRVPIPNRTMLLLTGPVDELRDAPRAARAEADPVPHADYQEPHLVWPEDRAWCLACEVDEEIEFSIGCSVATYQALDRELPDLVRPVAYGVQAPLYRE